MPIRNPKDFWSGLLFLGVGGAVVLLARNYQLGTALRMGPGYFPTALGSLLAVVGVVAVARSFIRPGMAIEPFPWRLLLIVLGATLLCGVLVRNADNTIRVDNRFEGRLERLADAMQRVIVERLFATATPMGSMLSG